MPVDELQQPGRRGCMFTRSSEQSVAGGNFLIRGADVNEKRWVWAVCWMVLAVLNASGARAEQTPGACITCHEGLGGTLAKPITVWKGSIHYQHDITCDSCHGGNDEVVVGNVSKLSGAEFAAIQAAAMSKSHGFVGKPSGQEMFSMCELCHSASVRMFADSIMGKAYLQNKGGPSCVTCHNAHRNTMPAVSETCSKCHADTSGYEQIDPMNVTDATIAQLSRIRIRLAGEKTRGSRPSLAPRFPGEMDSYQVGLLAFGVIVFLFLLGCTLYEILEKGDEK
ncbi:MAG: cytochrome c3 family protein [Syntrophobacteraceae bacterium]